MLAMHKLAMTKNRIGRKTCGSRRFVARRGEAVAAASFTCQAKPSPVLGQSSGKGRRSGAGVSSSRRLATAKIGIKLALIAVRVGMRTAAR